MSPDVPETTRDDAERVDAVRQTGEAVPLQKRPIPDQLDYFAEKLAAQINPGEVPREAIIAMGAAVVGLGAIATELRKQGPLTDEYGMLIRHLDTTTSEGAIAPTLAEALEVLADFDARSGPGVLSRTLRVRPVGPWRDAKEADRG